MRSRLSGWLYIILGLAVIGLVSQLFTNTAQFMKTILYVIGFSIVVFFIIRAIFFNNKARSNDMRKYKQAVRQSKLKYKHRSEQQPIPTFKRTKRNKVKRRATHLRVIDGHKSKRKNRATF